MLVNKLDLRRQVDSIEQELDKKLPYPTNIEEAKQLLIRSAQKYVRETTKKAAELRKTYLKEQAIQLETADDPKTAEIRKRIAKAEAIKKMYMKLR